jgi:hypothetical protein
VNKSQDSATTSDHAQSHFRRFRFLRLPKIVSTGQKTQSANPATNAANQIRSGTNGQDIGFSSKRSAECSSDG